MNAINECSFHSKWTKFPDKNFVKILLTKLLLYEKKLLGKPHKNREWVLEFRQNNNKTTMTPLAIFLFLWPSMENLASS